MNHLKLAISTCTTAEGVPYRALEISIDGVSFIELVKQHEAPMAEREGHPEIAGEYAWCPFSEPLFHALLGEQTDEEHKVSLLLCPCGEPGCWPLLAHVKINNQTVSWCSFEQPHRSEVSAAGHWSYVSFGPFQFERSRYADILKGLA